MKYKILIAILILAFSLNAVNWDCNVNVSGTADIGTNINTFKNSVLTGANNVFDNAHVIINIIVDGSLMISVSITGELSASSDLEGIAGTVKNYFENLLDNTETDITYNIKLVE